MLTFILAYITPINGNDTLIRFKKYMICIALFIHPPRKSIYDVTAHQMQNWTQY